MSAHGSVPYSILVSLVADQQEDKEALTRLKSNKASGVDGISTEVIHFCSYELQLQIQNLIREEVIPGYLRDAIL